MLIQLKLVLSVYYSYFSISSLLKIFQFSDWGPRTPGSPLATPMRVSLIVFYDRFIDGVSACSEHQSRFYATQVALGLEYMQYMELVYRDLKPENILINVNGYLKVHGAILLSVVVITQIDCNTAVWLIENLPVFTSDELAVFTNIWSALV